MWLITTCIAALIATAFWYKAPKKYYFEIPTLMFWGATLMIFVDHILGYEGGAFIEMETTGLITNTTILGIVMILPILLFWGIYVFIKKQKTTTQTR